VPYLKAALVNSEVAQHGLRFERKQDLSKLLGIGTPSLSYRLCKELTPCIRIGRLNGGGAVELPLIRFDEFLVSGVRKSSFPKGAAVDELGVLSEPLVVLGEQAIGQAAQHPDIEI